MNASDFAQAIKNRKTVFGTCITMTSPHMVKFIDDLGTDFLFIDTEHIPQDREMLSWMCHAFIGKGQTPLVRIPSPDIYETSKVLDGGAMAVLIPYVETVEQVMMIGATIKYRPLKGDKLQKLVHGNIILSRAEQQYLDEFNKDRLFFINIESTEGIKNLDAMLNLNLVDAVIIGPHDLSVSLGIAEDYTNQKFEDAVQEIIAICVRHGVSVGNHFSVNRDSQLAWAKCGMNIILNSSDMGAFVSQIKDDMNYLRNVISNRKYQKNSAIII
ncbi:MAG: aldolase/citrate lyase family protein [Spirochaetales bacterium]